MDSGEIRMVECEEKHNTTDIGTKVVNAEVLHEQFGDVET